jgi:hypothetical protein
MQIKISILLFEENLTNVQLIFPKQNQHEQNLKQNNLWGGLNLSSIKHFTQLQHKFSTLATPHTNPTQPKALFSYLLKNSQEMHCNP